MKKFIAVLASLLVSVSLFACDKPGEEGEIPPAPDYSDSTETMRMYGYYGPTEGIWRLGDKEYNAGQSFRTVERYKEYLEAGLNTFMMGGTDTSMYDYKKGDWNDPENYNHHAKQIMDQAYEAGLKEILVNDTWIRHYSSIEGGVVGDGKLFATEADLDAEIARCMAAYKDHPAFYGVMLHDEPKYTQLKAVGEVYKAVKRVCPEAQAYCNLWPPAYSSIGTHLPPPEDGSEPDLEESWKAYLRMFVEETGAEYIKYDHYPIEANSFNVGYIRGLQMSAEVARELDVDFHFTAQTFGMRQDGDILYRQMEEADGYLITNMLLGFGVKELAYYTYWNMPNNPSELTYGIDGTSFISWTGQKTDLYYFMQKINAEIQKFAPVIKNFEYQASTYYTVPPTNFSNAHVASAGRYGMERNELAKVKEVTLNKETALVTELKDPDNGQYMYMVLNIIDPSKGSGSTAYETITVKFADEYKYAAVYDKGEKTCVRLDEGCYTLKLKPGAAQFIMPY